jgi:membrane-bound metal-dependent hydrolase YbcI (DUF457 family)
MPFTPFHFGPGAAVHALAPRQISFLAFCATNVLVDVEPAYFMLTGQYPLHRFFHSYLGVSFVIVATVAGFRLARWMADRVRITDLFGWQQLRTRGVLLGSALGGYSHVFLDSIMHDDIRPLAPFADTNTLYLWIGLDSLHQWCVAAGVVGLVVVWLRRRPASS